MSGIEEALGVGGAGAGGAAGGAGGVGAGTGASAGAIGAGTGASLGATGGLTAAQMASLLGTTPALETALGGGAAGSLPGLLGTTSAFESALAGGAGGAAPEAAATPGVLGQLVTGLGNLGSQLGHDVVNQVTEHPFQSAAGTAGAYKQLREEFRGGSVQSPQLARKPLTPSVAPQFQTGAPAASPAERFQLIMSNFLRR